MIVGMVVFRVDFGPMRTHELNAIKGDLFTTPERPYDESDDETESS